MASRTRKGKPGDPEPVRRRDLFRLMEVDYCTGVTRSLKETAAKHGVAEGTAFQYSSLGGWTEKRAEFLRKRNEAIEAEMAERLLREKRRVVREQLSRARKLNELGLSAIESADPSEIGAMTAIAALKTAAEMERKILRLEDDKQSVSVQVAVVPLLAQSQTDNLGGFIEALGGKRGEGQP